MEGITILSEQITKDLSIGGFSVVCFLSICVCIFGIIAIWFEWSDKDTPLGYKIGVSILVGFLSFLLVLEIIDLVPEMQPYIEYQVTIDDTVGFNAFHSQYEILNQVGQVFTVRLKEVLS